MGCGWYRTAYYPPEARIDRRSVDDLADELVREASEGVGESGDPAGIIGEIGTDKPWVSPAEERVHRAAARASRADRAGDHDPRRPVGRRARPAPDLRGGGRRSRRGSSSATPIRTRSSTTTSRSSSAARTSSSTSSGCRSAPASATARPRMVELAVRAAVARPRRPGPAQPGRLQRLPAHALRRQRLHVPDRDVPAAAPRRRRHRRRDRDDDGREPAAAADDRVDRPRRRRLSPRASPRR